MPHSRETLITSVLPLRVVSLFILMVSCTTTALSGEEHPETGWQTMQVHGASMAPTVQHGDLICLHKKPKNIEYGQIVAIRISDKQPPLLKRVIAVAGDRVEIRQGKVWRNGHVVTAISAYRKKHSVLQTQLKHYGNKVPPANLITLGDNPDHSFDSHDFGLVEADQVLGIIDLHKKTVRLPYRSMLIYGCPDKSQFAQVKPLGKL